MKNLTNLLSVLNKFFFTSIAEDYKTLCGTNEEGAKIAVSFSYEMANNIEDIKKNARSNPHSYRG